MSLNNAVLASLRRAFETGKRNIKLTGSTSPAFLAWILSQEDEVPTARLIVCANQKAAINLNSDIRAMKPDLGPILFEPFDESPYSGLYPSQSCIQARTHFLWRATHSKPGEIFITSIAALLQKTAPIEQFKFYEVTLKKGEEIDFEILARQLVECGYVSSPLVEDSGMFSKRGGILDIFSPAHTQPVRLEFFGDQIESIRFFDPDSQRSEKEIDQATVIPAREILLTPELTSRAKKKIKEFCDDHSIGKDVRETLLEPLKQNIYSHGIDYWLSSFYENAPSALDAFRVKPLIYWLDDLEITRSAHGLLEQHRAKFRDLIKAGSAVPDPDSLYLTLEQLKEATENQFSVAVDKIHIDAVPGTSMVPGTFSVTTRVFDTSDLSTLTRAARESKKDYFEPAAEKIKTWKADGFSCFIWSATLTQSQRIKYLFETHGLEAELVSPEAFTWAEWRSQQDKNKLLIHIIPRSLTESGRLQEDKVAFIREEDIFGERVHREYRKNKGTLEQRTDTLSFGDLNPGDFIVHTLHGIGIYEGLKKISVQAIENEFIQLKYKDGDKLYLPVYRISQIQKYTAPGGTPVIDRLGSTSWLKAKVKVRNALKDVASELLELYAKRKSAVGFAFSAIDDDFKEFEATFPYDETPDQSKAIRDVLGDMQQDRPMDRLVCGDVGFGKTEVAIRAAYKAVQDKKQVAVLVPTTVLAFQHFQTFTKRFANSAVSVAMLSRFSSAKEMKKDLQKTHEGKIDILIGTHRLLSKDVQFKDLGLLVVDEEQHFGVTHKERIKRLRTQVDVLTLSATPIPRTLNMALMGVRDLSLIATPPEDRLAIRTFINRFDEDTIRKALTGEIQRGGQVYFIHNRVQSIHGFGDQIRSIVPGLKLRIAHGQMPDDALEKTMLDFYNHEFDVLLCTTIIESGLDIPSANTILIDRADTFGLSQLYQLRGRVGRSKERAYCYLLIPPQGIIDKTAQERLKIIQEYTELGSGFHIAHHDLELRGSGNILGEDQSGHISAVGYELYMDLLEQALGEAKGETPAEDDVEPEINLRIPALIPDSYIEDIRLRLGYYKMLSEIEEESDLQKIEMELVDRFGQLPTEVTNLFGVMLIRRLCKDLSVRDISAGPKNVSLLFTNATKVKPEAVIKLATFQSKKYQITPDQGLIIRLNSITWPGIVEELKLLKKALL